MDWAVVRERKRNHCRFHILPADQYWQEREEGCWTHYSFETVKFFDSGGIVKESGYKEEE